MVRATDLAAEDASHEATARTAAAPAGLRLDLLDGFEAAADCWRALEATGIASPYQRLAWQRSFAAHALAPGERLAVVALRDGEGRAVFLAALVVSRRVGPRLARPLGGKHANFVLPLFAPCSAGHFTPDAVRAMLREAGGRLGVDALVLHNLPRLWRGQANPLALPEARPSPSNAHRLCLRSGLSDGLPTVLGRETRKKLRKKERGLAGRGALALMAARTPDEVRAVLAAFHLQKGPRLRALGIEDPFAEPGARAFLEAAALPGPDGTAPAVRLWALTLDGAIIATFGAACDGRRACGMINSFDLTPEIARASPGDLLILKVIADLAAEGYETFDLGVGDARYKTNFCDETEELCDLVVPVTALGQLYAPLARLVGDVKRRAKTSPRLWAQVERARRLTAALRPRR